jgi:restriction endonuclease S subunit
LYVLNIIEQKEIVLTIKMIEEKRISNDYKIVKLGDVCEIVSGNTPKGLEKISNKSGIPFYKVSDMNLEGNEVEMKLSK